MSKRKAREGGFANDSEDKKREQSILSKVPEYATLCI